MGRLQQRFKHNTKLGRWNGRQIGNAFQTAVSLAHYDGQDDNLAKIDPVTGRKVPNWEHFKKVLETRQQFDESMAKVVSATDGELSQRQRIRLDDYARPATTRPWSSIRSDTSKSNPPTPWYRISKTPFRDFDRPLSDTTPADAKSSLRRRERRLTYDDV